MKIDQFEIQGLKLITPRIFGDDRGFFCERFNTKAFSEMGLPTNLIQDNFSRSKSGVLRGLHYQNNPSQLKLVTCLRGKVFDVAVDLRRDSPTFGKHQSVILDGDNPQWFLIPAGFAHGFLVMSDEPADFFYKVDNYYHPAGEGSILWNDPDLGIDWPAEVKPFLNAKDLAASRWSDFVKINPF
jgi:dTDP-4-dehydrorhamnose 3,5-epimerase